MEKSNDTTYSYRARRRPLILFVLFAYAFSWIFWLLAAHQSGSITPRLGNFSLRMPLRALLSLVGDLGPGLSALIVLLGSDVRSLRDLFRRLIPRSVKWTALVLSGPVVLVALCVLCSGVFVGGFLTFSSTEQWLRVFAINLPFAPLWEEIGWRGYLLPRVERVFKPIAASLIVGVIWGFWHIPLYLRVRIPGSPNGSFLFCFLVYTLAWSVLFTWLYNATKGNLSAVVLLHATLNATVIAFLGRAMALTGIRPFLVFTAGTWFLAIILVVLTGSDLSYKACDESHA
jgi:membrane protease YdiL (CAAX protease family)